MQQVRAALDPDEPNYVKAAKDLGPKSLPHLERLVFGEHPLLAAKATHLTGLIGGDKAISLLKRAVHSKDVRLRIAAAGATSNLDTRDRSEILQEVIDDADIGVQKMALKAAAIGMSDELRSRVEDLSTQRGKSFIKLLSGAVLKNKKGTSL